MSLDDPRSSREVVRALLAGPAPQRNSLVLSVEGLLSGIGYNLRDAANVARANDQLVRARASGLLGQAADALTEGEARFREAHVPPATREQPYPPAEAMQALRKLDALTKRARELASAVLTLEAPGSDRIWSRLRDERELLELLLAADVGLVGAAHDVLDGARALGADAIKGRQLAGVEKPLEAVNQAVQERRELLSTIG